ncbi:MAG: hypothetical protein HUU14_05505 [Dehalococcoidia bacterium]|nr:MAG: hypothetical protein EDM76_13085 [bacterium]MCE7927235.1 hypothetical protein [Chloroflexi bacterium CFX7]MCL4230568.1 hypothetical protein [Dehalococcoidia bacterium]NUQ55321.1 hypothetical protein [Dehalococcoidia bacterium]
MDPNLVINRIVRLAKLDTTVFDEVRDDERELVPAIVVAVVSTIISAIGAWLYLLFKAPDGVEIDFGNVFVKEILLGSIFSIVLWGVWVGVAYVVLVQFYREQADMQSLLRTMGYAAFPLSLSILMLITPMGLGLGITAMVLWFVMSTYAIQATTSASSDHVVMANAVGFLVFAIVLSFLADQSGMAPGVWIFSGDAVGEGEFYKIDLGGLEDLFK